MLCPKCGFDKYNVLRTVRGDEFDLREVACRKGSCRHIYHQVSYNIDVCEYEKRKQEIQDEVKATH